MESAQSGNVQILSKKNICDFVARLKPGGWKNVYDLLSKLPHSVNNQGYYFDMDRLPDETIKRLSAYLLESSSVFADFIRSEKEHVGLVHQAKKKLEPRQKKGCRLVEDRTFEDDLVNDDEHSAEYDEYDDMVDVSDDEKCEIDDAEIDADDVLEEASPISDFDELVAKYSRSLSDRRKYLGTYFTGGSRWRIPDYKEVDELLRNEYKSAIRMEALRFRAAGNSRATLAKKTKKHTSDASSRARTRRLPDVLERENYTTSDLASEN